MGFFDWAAPLVRRYGDRFDEQDAALISSWLRPAVAPGGRILDVGGGAGQLATLLSDALEAHVTVLEPTARLLAHVPEGERIAAVRGRAEAMPFSDSSFDGLVVTDAFHHFRDQSAAVVEFARVVRPDGIVLVIEPDPRLLVVRAIALAERLVGEPAAFLAPDELRASMASAGILGECETLARGSYRFLGRVLKPGSAA
jgi:demethylmenaquinone methyltransferase/2-methoxy-6-polyprenyl-1,4-benzoquinol methylase